ncbi:hypothetical protein AB6A40_006067 [Gnathostoma spinigerum]|uniref:Uncharacterized protein n=1 Tax=Gnathostoma spinigerum TaxID=75299 RepID=A0ABD6EHB6_9BILA
MINEETFSTEEQILKNCELNGKDFKAINVSVKCSQKLHIVVQKKNVHYTVASNECSKKFERECDRSRAFQTDNLSLFEQERDENRKTSKTLCYNLTTRIDHRIVPCGKFSSKFCSIDILSSDDKLNRDENWK